MTDAELRALCLEKNAEYRAVLSISTLGWNGNNLLAGAGVPTGCALRLG
ncbi:MAG: hypothetical protein GX592_03150 [Clostridiales bacterium]|nr:hypothetical protein [Clostridiales bacterium]